MDSIKEEQAQLKVAIAALEGQRAVLGDEVVATTVAAMRERLAELVQQATQPQHKQITVLIADLSGFTAMSEAMDAEEVRDTIDAIWRRLDGIIVAWGGQVDQHLGDGIVALFGVPVAREDDPIRAVAAALAMQQALLAFNRETRARPDLGMRIGVSTGRALLAPDSSGEGLTAVGQTVRLAERLEARAPVGAILISHEVYRHVSGRFDVSGADTLTDFAHPVYHVHRERPRQARSSRRGVEGIETRMIGREAEMLQLQVALEQAARQGQAQAVTVVGDAGVGKSRLRYEFKQGLRQPDQERMAPFLLETGADRQMRRLPYSLVRDLLSSFCGIAENEPIEEARQKLVRGVAGVLRSRRPGAEDEAVQRPAHFIGELIGFDFSHSPHLEGLDEDARQIRQQAFAALVRFFNDLAAANPAVILLEDIHWADEGSLDLLLHLMRECGQGRLLLVCLTRPSLFERRPAWQQLAQPGMVHTLLTLAPLSAHDSHRLLREILQKVPRIPPYLANLIVDGAGGNPFYMEEMVKVLIEDGAIEKMGERWQVREDQATLRVPPTLTGVLQARLDRLPAAEREVLQQAAVVGRVFWDSAIAAINSDITAELHEILGTLEEKELIFQRNSSLFAGAREYTFKHAVLRRVTYESLLRQQRCVHHARVAGWLADQGGP